MIQKLKELAGDGYLYLATPYSKHPEGISKAFLDACKAAGWFIRNGIGVFCPIAHTHPIAVHCKISLLDHEVWLPADKPMMDMARGIVVCQMPSWEESYGIRHEIEVFQKAGKPVEYLPWPLSE